MNINKLIINFYFKHTKISHIMDYFIIFLHSNINIVQLLDKMMSEYLENAKMIIIQISLLQT